MEKKNVADVVIDGTIYKLAGYESSEYLQQVAGYLNNKIMEMKALDGYGHLPTAQKALMLELNAADDYFKARKAADHLEKELNDKDKELYTVKHDLVALQMKQEESGRNILSLREENAELQKKVIELEARLSGGSSLQAEPLTDQAPSDMIISDESHSDDSHPGESHFGESEDRLSSEKSSGKEDPEEEPAAENQTQEEGGAGQAETSLKTEPDTGEVFRPGRFTDSEAKESASDGEDNESAEDKSRKTFIPDAAGREAMMRNARENFLAASKYGNRKHKKR